MKTTQTDPIIDELRAVRDQHAAKCGYDVDAIFRDIRAREKGSGREYVSRPARRVRGRDTSTVGMGDESTFGHYMIGVFDVLGQSQKLREQTAVPLRDDPVERRRVVANLKDTVGVVRGFRRMFSSYFETAAQSASRADSLPEPQRSEMRAAMASNVLLWGVSDAIFVAVPLAWERHPAARVFDVFRSLLAAGSMWLVALATNHPIRGGMEIGTGIDIEPGEIYGQGLEAAYRLESRIAGRPRIVVGPTCVNFLQAVKRSEGAAVGSRMAASAAELCLSMLREDTDGHTVVDGLGQTMLEQTLEVPEFRAQFPRAHHNVRTQCRHFRDTGNAKLASRYEALRAYFDERAPKWRATPRTDT